MLTSGTFFLSGLSQKYKLKDIAVVGEKMKDALLASEWAELWPGARAGSHPSSAPPSLQPCPFYARLPACTTRSCAKLFPPSYDLGGQRSPRICSRVIFLGKKMDVLGWRVGGGMLLRLGTCQPVPRLSCLHVYWRWPLSPSPSPTSSWQVEAES